MRIAILAPGDLPIPASQGGAIETLVTHLLQTNAMNDDPLDIVVVTRAVSAAPATPSEVTHYSIVQLGDRRLRALLYESLWRLARKATGGRIAFRSYFVRRFGAFFEANANFDAVLVEGDIGHVLPLRRMVDCPLLLHVHADVLNAETGRGPEIVKACDKVIVVSEYLKRRVQEIEGADEHRILVLRNVVDVAPFKKRMGLNEREAARAELQIARDDVVFLYCGRLSTEKGVLQLIEAFRAMNTKHCKLIIAGSTWFSRNRSDAYTDRLHAETYGVRERVIFTGYVPHAKTPQLYALADVCVVPSIGNEAAGLALLEASASGLAVVTTDRGGIPEYAEPGCCTIVPVTLDFVPQLSLAMARVADDREYLTRIRSDSCTKRMPSLASYYESFRRIIANDGPR